MSEDENFWVEVAERANEILGRGSLDIEDIDWHDADPADTCEAAVKAHEEILDDNPKSRQS